MPCPICTRIAHIRAGSEPAFIAELPESYAVLHDHQRYEGWTVLWLKDHADHLADLTPERQARLFHDVATTANALRAAVQPQRLNYECLGNQVHHVHWHVIPRPADDPAPRDPIWVRPNPEWQTGVTPDRRDALIARIRAHL